METKISIPKDVSDFLNRSLGIDLRVRKWYTLFDVQKLDKMYPFPHLEGKLRNPFLKDGMS